MTTTVGVGREANSEKGWRASCVPTAHLQVASQTAVWRAVCARGNAAGLETGTWHGTRCSSNRLPSLLCPIHIRYMANMLMQHTCSVCKASKQQRHRHHCMDRKDLQPLPIDAAKRAAAGRAESEALQVGSAYHDHRLRHGRKVLLPR